MKTEISRDSHQPQKRYSGVYQQQGRMLTDADWNELVEILKERLNDALKDVVGNKAGSMGGTPRHRALKVIAAKASEIFKIKPGHIYIDGVAAQVSGDADIAYGDQLDFPSPPGLPTAPGPPPPRPPHPPPPPPGFPRASDLPSAPSLANNYIIYADVWERTVTHLMDERLRDKGLHGADTCTRKQTMAQVKWCPKTVDPEQSAKNPPKGDAELSLKLHEKTTEPDPCDPCAAQLDVESKTGNYLFRVEIHDVKGDANDPSEITLKWSSENGAEQFEALPTKEKMPAEFISDKWIYEFFDKTSEKHLGVHFRNSQEPPWQPARGVLKEPSSPYTVPAIPGSSETEKFVRRWDGYCTLDLSSKSLIKGMDRGVTLSTSKASNAPGYVKIDSSLQIILASIKFDMVLDGKKFVAGDYWLADVREAEHDPLDIEKSKLIESKPPHGIEHHYLTLGNVAGGTLQPNPEADRKYAFPSLTEMTRMFHVGGDGQEAMPNHTVPQPLKVGVTNGEWPVEGASVAFLVEEGNGAISRADSISFAHNGLVVKTNEFGVATCSWELGPGGNTEERKQRVTVRLVDPESVPGDADYPRYLGHPPIHFYANLSTADQVAYEPGCPDSGQNTVHSHLATDSEASLVLGEDGYYTVKEVLDALLCKLKAKHLPYDNPDCDSLSVTVKSLLLEIGLDFDNNGHITVSDVLDTLLCKLRASHIPFYPDECTEGEPTTVKTKLGIDVPMSIHAILQKLICELDAADIPFDPKDCDSGVLQPTVKTGLSVSERTTIHEVLQKLLCKLDAGIIPYNPNKSPATTSRWRDIKEQSGTGELSEPDTVQAAIDDLIQWLESSDIAYQLPNCRDAIVSVRRLLFPDDGSSTVRDVLNALLCVLDASTIPYDINTDTGSLKDGFVNKSGDRMTGDLSVNGTVAATAFEGDGSALTGISAGKWSDGAGGAIYYNAGNVGIGTPNPEGILDVKADHRVTPQGVLRVTRYGNDSKQLVIGNTNKPSVEWFVRVDNSSNFSVNREGLADVPLYIKNNGKVGIGTTGPSHTLDVRGATATYLAYFKNYNNGTGTAYGLCADGDARHSTASSQGIGAVFYGRGSLEGAGASGVGSMNYAYAYGLSNAYAVYASGVGGSTTGREYAFFGIGDGYFSGKVGIGTEPSQATGGNQRHLEIESAWGHWIFLKQKRSTNGGGGFIIHNPWKNTDGDERNRLEIGYLTSTGEHKWGHFSIHGTTGNVRIGPMEPDQSVYKLEVHGKLWVRNWATVGRDYAEYFESQNGKAISAGTAVVLENGKARRAKKNETPIGIVSANPGMAGGVHVEWPKKYLQDEFGSLIMEKYQKEITAPKKEKIKKERQKVKKKTIEEEVIRTEIVFEKKKYRQKEITETVTREIEEPVFKEVDLYDAEGKNKIGRHKIPVMETYEEEIEVLDEDGQPVLVGTGKFVTEQRPKLNPDYDESREYMPREKRPEWNCVGLLGQLHLRKGQPVAPTWIKIKDISDKVELWLVK